VNPISSKYGAPLLPQVNLVPKDINDKRTMSLVRTVAALSVVGVLVLVGIVFFGAYAAKTVAKNGLHDALVAEDDAVTERDAKADVYYDYVKQETQEFTILQIGWAEINYSALLTSILAQDNPEVSFDSVHIYGPSDSAIGGPAVDPLLGGGVGAFDFEAKTRSYEDAMKLVERLELVPGIAKVTLTDQAYKSEGEGVSWSVTGRGTLTPLLLTGRLSVDGGVVEQQVMDALLGSGVGMVPETPSPSPEPTPEPTPTAESEE
jgi:hypothetical protein